jgi:hypothetical protein
MDVKPTDSDETDLIPEASAVVGMRSFVLMGVISGSGGRGFG